MKIIDFHKKGNVVRFFLGEDDLKEWWGDDWDDCPYEHNAGEVYDEYISGYTDIAFNFDDCVLEPCDGAWNSEYSKEDMVKRHVPCIIVVPSKVAEDSFWGNHFQHWVGNDCVRRYYFGDHMEMEHKYEKEI